MLIESVMAINPRNNISNAGDLNNLIRDQLRQTLIGISTLQLGYLLPSEDEARQQEARSRVDELRLCYDADSD